MPKPINVTDSPDGDARLLAELLAGDERAMEALAARHERSLLGLALGLLGGDEALARDAVQETWMRVLRYGGGFSGRCAVKTWMTRILVNRCRDLARRRRPTSSEGLDDATGAIDAPTGDGVDELGAMLRDAVEALPRIQREIVILCYHDGITHATAAEILDVPVGTVKSRLHAALQSLRARLSREEVVA